MPVQILGRKGWETMWFCFSHERQRVFDCPTIVGLRGFPGGSLSHSIGVQWKPADLYKLDFIPNLESNFHLLSVALLHSAKPLLSKPQNSEYLFKKVLCDFLIIFHDNPALFSIIMKWKTFKISFNIKHIIYATQW